MYMLHFSAYSSARSTVAGKVMANKNGLMTSGHGHPAQSVPLSMNLSTCSSPAAFNRRPQTSLSCKSCIFFRLSSTRLQLDLLKFFADLLDGLMSKHQLNDPFFIDFKANASANKLHFMKMIFLDTLSVNLTFLGHITRRIDNFEHIISKVGIFWTIHP